MFGKNGKTQINFFSKIRTNGGKTVFIKWLEMLSFSLNNEVFFVLVFFIEGCNV